MPQAMTDINSAAALLNQIKAPCLIISPASGGIVAANPAAVRLYGYDLQQLQAMNIADINTMSPDEIQHEMQLASTENRNYFIFQHRLADGHIRHVEVWSGPVELDGEVLLYSIVNDITARKQQEFALARSEQMFRAVFEQAASGVAVVETATGRFLRVNQTYSRLVGYSVDELTSMCFRDITHPEDLAQDDAFVQQLLEREISQETFEKRYIHKNGHIVWARVSVSAMDDPELPTRRNITVIQDITESRHTMARLAASQQALAESESRLQMVMDATGEGVWDWDIVNHRVVHNRQWCNMLGYTDEALEHDIDFFIARLHEDDRERVGRILERSLQHDVPYLSEHRMVRADGSVFWVLDRGKVVKRDAAGNPLRMCGSVSDIDSKVRSEQQLLEQTNQMDLIFKLSPDGFVAIDAADRIKYVNPAFSRLTGISSEQLLGLESSHFCSLLSAACHSINPLVLQGVASDDGENAMQGMQQQVIELHHPGHKVLLMQARKSMSADTSCVLYFRDITHETHVDRMKSEFMSTAAHELRTPMTSIYGFAELMLNDTFDEVTRQEMLGHIYQQSKLMRDIINELLDLSRLEEGRGMDFHFDTLSLNVLVHDVIQDFGVPMGRNALSIPDCETELFVRGDASKLRQCLFNMLSNAYKYSPGGGEVSISLLHDDSRVGIAVQDHGIGMTAEERARVTERFYRADQSGNIPGTGLGMSIVSNIIEVHKGELDIVSVPGEGTTISIWLPSLNL